MKKTIIFLLIAVLVSSAAVADITRSTGTSKSTPAQQTSQSQQGISFVLNKPVTVGSETYPAGTVITPPYGPGSTEVKIYLAASQTITVLGVSVPVLNPESATYLDSRTASYAKSHPNYDYSAGSFTFTTSKPESGTIEDYRTDTTVTIRADGSKTVEQATYVCGQGVLRECTGTYIEIEGSRQSVTYAAPVPAPAPPARAGQPTAPAPRGVPYIPAKTTTYYAARTEQEIADNVQPRVAATGTSNYNYDPRSGTLQPATVDVKDSNGNLIHTIDDKGEEHFYQDINKDGKIDPKTEEVPENKADLTPMQEMAIDREHVSFVNDGGAHFGDACALLGTARCVGRFLRAFQEYRGLREYSAIGLDDYDQRVKEKKAKIQQEFCIAMGISQCIASKICEQRHELQAGNTVAGRGPGGQFVTSASLNAERTTPIEVEGMTRQQLIDMFGNATVVGGRLINLTDPNFKPEVLGRLKLRLYHVQYSITNNAVMDEDETLSYDIVFVRIPETINSSYGTPAGKSSWYSGAELPKLAYQQTGRDDLYKFSAQEYSDVCLIFNPGLPSGGVSGGSALFGGEVDIVNRLCVPFQESTTPTAAIPPGATAPPPATTPAQAPGGMV